MTELTELPDEGTFEKIHRRLVWRRFVRVGLPVLGAAVAVAALAAVALWPKVDEAEGHVVAMNGMPQPMAVAAGETMTAQETAPAVATPAATAAKAQAGNEEEDLGSLLPDADLQVVRVQPYAAEPTKRMSGFAPDEMNIASPAAGRPAAKKEEMPTAAVAAEAAQAAAPAPKAGEPQPEPYHEDDLLWAPNIIVPNGDVDANRTFSLKTSSTLKDFRVHIYNRRGQRIFSSTDQAFVWDATYDGAAAPQGAYVWVATFRDSDGTARSETGTVVVVR